MKGPSEMEVLTICKRHQLEAFSALQYTTPPMTGHCSCTLVRSDSNELLGEKSLLARAGSNFQNRPLERPYLFGRW